MGVTPINRVPLWFFVAWFGSYADLYVFQLTGFKPLYSYFMLLGYFIIWIVICRAVPGLNYRGIRRFLVWIGLYLVYGCLAFLNSSQDSEAVQAFITLGEAVILSGAFVVLFSQVSGLCRVQVIFAMLAVLATLVNVYDFFHPLFTKVPGRAAGLYVNPNIAGHFIAMTMVAAIDVVPRRARFWLILVCGLGVLLTFSRASWILWGLGVVWLGWLGQIGPARNRWAAVSVAGVIGLGVVGLLFSGQIGGLLTHSSVAGHLDANTLVRLGVGRSSLSGYAASEREALVWASLRTGAQAPIFGHGLGFTREWQYPVGPHDMYLLFWVEGGVIGIFLYLGLMMLLWRHSSAVGRIVAVQLIVAGVFTHNQLEQPAFLIMTAFVFAHHAVRAKKGGRVSPLMSEVSPA
ncbi:MAG: O-antigen ligase family protein [Gammaproteobacteria bacterium]|jgi:O-antigen ligase